MGKTTEAFVSVRLFQHGIGYVLVSRAKGQDEVESGVFLVDVYCLGVKSALFRRLTRWEHDTDFAARVFGEQEKERIEPAAARRLVEGAVAYAGALGFAPCSDYKKAARVFGGISSQDSTATFTFGKDGKPLYFQGPNETPERARQIVKILHARCGEGKYHYVVLADESQVGDLSGDGPEPTEFLTEEESPDDEQRP